MIPANTTESKRRNPFRGFAAPFAESRTFTFLWLGHLISFLGSSVTMVILPVMLPISGHIVDRYDRVKIMMLADIARFVIMLATAALSLTEVLTIPLLLVLVGFYGCEDYKLYFRKRGSPRQLL